MKATWISQSWCFELLDGADGDPAGDAVVEALGDDGFADLVEGGVEDDHVADFDLFFDVGGGEAEVDEEFGDVGDFSFFFIGGDVGGFAGGVEDAGEVAARSGFRTDGDEAGEEVAGVEAADGVDAEEAGGVDVFDKEADLVHVRGEHDF